MKKAAALLLTMIILIGSISIVASAAGETTVSLGEVTAKRGETVTMDLTLANNPGITGLVVTIGYDKTAMELTNVANGTLFGQFAQDKPCVGGGL